jgi:CubicO group peptidase (beta-lactamase class C family)
MRLPRSVSALATVLIVICLLGAPDPARSAAADRFPRETVEHEQIDAYILARMRATRIPGLALGVVRGDQTVYLKGYGVAGPDGRPVTPQTPFILGSTSKSITALAVMQLVEAGKIDLDTPVITYLPWFRTDDEGASARITVRNLLHQNSGLPVDVGRAGLAEDDQSDTALEDGARQLAGVQLNHPPGQTYEYANEKLHHPGPDHPGSIKALIRGVHSVGDLCAAPYAPQCREHLRSRGQRPRHRPSLLALLASRVRCTLPTPDDPGRLSDLLR